MSRFWNWLMRPLYRRRRRALLARARWVPMGPSAVFWWSVGEQIVGYTGTYTVVAVDYSAGTIAVVENSR